MRSKLLIAAVAGCMSTVVFAEDPKMPAKDSILPQGVTTKQSTDQANVRRTLAEATNAAMTKGGFDDLVERLSTEDRTRLGDFPKREFTELDGRIEQIRKNWQEKYGQTFNLNNPDLFENFTVYQGEVTDAGTARTHWPVSVYTMHDAKAVTPNDAHAGEHRPSPTDKHVTGTTPANYLENGRKIAVVRVPAASELPGVNLSFVHEPIDFWKIDIPDNITGQQIHDNVKTALTFFGDNVASWPADEKQAYRAFGQRILLALTNVPQTSDSKTADVGRD